MKRAGEKDERIHPVAAWRHAPYFTAAERAALELTEAVTRLSDGEDPVRDSVWKEAAKYYDESALAALSSLNQCLEPPERRCRPGRRRMETIKVIHEVGAELSLVSFS